MSPRGVRDLTFDDIVCVATAISLATQHDISPQAHIARLVSIFMSGIATR